ncbi:hypothetical protein ACXDJZ_005569 [Klebsiella variicola]
MSTQIHHSSALIGDKHSLLSIVKTIILKIGRFVPYYYSKTGQNYLCVQAGAGVSSWREL